MICSDFSAFYNVGHLQEDHVRSRNGNPQFEHVYVRYMSNVLHVLPYSFEHIHVHLH
jgi:hypothetical protein